MWFGQTLTVVLLIQYAGSTPLRTEHDNQDNQGQAAEERLSDNPNVNSQFVEENGVIRRKDDTKIERLDAPMERIEIRLIDDHNNHSQLAEGYHDGIIGGGSHREEIVADEETQRKPETEQLAPQKEPSLTEEHQQSAQNESGQTGQMMSISAVYQEKYKKTEYVSGAASDPSSNNMVESTQTVENETDRRYGIDYGNAEEEENSDKKQPSIFATFTTITPPGADLDELTGEIDQLPVMKQVNEDDDDEPEPVEECLTNRNELKPEIVQELTQQTQKLGRMIRKLNKKQQMHCSEDRKHEESYRMCPNWREEKMIHYYKLMRITYCQDVDKWPNAPRFKRTYAQQLSLFETLYVFNKQ